MKFLPLQLIALCITVFSFDSKTFQDQINDDLTSKLSTGICDSIPEGSKILYS